MARNGSGSFSLVAGNPVTIGTQITATWANNTLSDIASELTGSVAADGQTTITGPIKFSAGSVSAPAMTFSSETNTGFYRSGAGVVSLSIAGSQKYIFGASSVTLGGSASITGTEFGYLTGVTSAIQTQLDAKQPLDATLTALAGTLTAANKIPYATAADTASELTFNPSTALSASTSTVASQTVVKTAIDDLVVNCTSATPDVSADYFVFEDATDSTQKKALLSAIASVGSGQTWTDVKTTPGRSLGTTYTNTTGGPISVHIFTVSATAGQKATLTINGVSIPGSEVPSNYGSSVSAIVPPGHTYVGSGGTGGSLSGWYELI